MRSRSGAGDPPSVRRSGAALRPRTVEPTIGTRPMALASSPPTVSTSSSSMVDVEQLGEVVDVQRGRRPGACRRRAPRPPGASRSYSSAISPTISSMMSSMVTRPGGAAVLVDDDRRSGSGRAASRAAGRRPACSRARSASGRISSVTAVPTVLGGGVEPAGDVLEVEQPATSSTSSPTTGIREKPERRKSDIALRSACPRRSTTMSVRGHHDLAGEGVAELEDGVDHLALVRLDDVRVAGHVDEVAQLALALERARRCSPCPA